MTIPLGVYLFNRVKQLEVESIFGLPGDFNLSLLDYIYDVPGMRWVGNTNELNASYAADGYSRVKRLAVLVTTFGVGELSALAGVAGSYAEHVGLVHVVGIPSTESQNKQLLLHHTLGDGDFHAFIDMSSKICKKVFIINDAETATKKIDEALREAFVSQRPIYLGIPTNFSGYPVDEKLLETPIDLSLPLNPPEVEQEVIEDIVKAIKNAKNPAILVDACASRHDCREEVKAVAYRTQFPVFATPMGKSMIDEYSPLFGGCYVGVLSPPGVAEALESADLVLAIGGLQSDFNTGSFTYKLTKNVIQFHSDYTAVKHAIYKDVAMKELLQKLLNKLPDNSSKGHPLVPQIKDVPSPAPAAGKITQKWFWPRIGQWLRPGDVVISETGTSSFGIVGTKFPKDTIGISQVLWGSIGYSVGAACGAVLAADDLKKTKNIEKRVILFVGDGSLQLTVTEISTMIRWGLTPYIFVLNNDGYTIERLIHGETATYNDVHMWKYAKLLDVFNAKDHQSVTVDSVGEIESLLKSSEFAEPSKIRLIEVMLPKMDAPLALVKQAEMTAATNAGK